MGELVNLESYKHQASNRKADRLYHLMIIAQTWRDMYPMEAVYKEAREITAWLTKYQPPQKRLPKATPRNIPISTV